MKPQRDLLVIDDEPVVLEAVTRICRSEKISVDAAADGRAGLEQLERSVYRLIICDLMMGGTDGFEFLAEANRRGCRTPIVTMTGNATVQNAVRSLQCGAIDCVGKPFTADELMAVIRRGLSFSALESDHSNRSSTASPCPAQIHRLGHLSWASIEPLGTVLIGVQPTFLETLSRVQGVELASEGAELVMGTGCATFSTPDGLTHELMCPVSGHVIDANTDVMTLPANVGRDPYGSGWLYRILPSDLAYCLKFLTSGAETSAPLALNRTGDSP